MQFGNVAESNLLTIQDCQNISGRGTVCVVPTYKCRTHTYFIFLNCSTLLSHPAHTHASQCKCAHTHMHMHTHTHHAQSHQIQTCIRYRYFGLILSSYSDRPNKSEQCIFTFHYPWPEAFDTVSSRSRVGITYLLLWHQTWKGSTVFTLLGSRKWRPVELAQL